MVNAIAITDANRYRLKGRVGAILLDSIRKVYAGGVVAVDGVSLEIESGEFLVLVGPSGCGKSTLLRMIAGLEEVTDGTIAIDERDVTDLPPRARDVAMVFQTYALYPHMTVRENLGYGLKVRKTAKVEIVRRVDEVADQNGALGHVLEAGDHAQQRRLPAAGRTDQHDELVVGNVEVDATHDFDVVEALDHVTQRDFGHVVNPSWRPR